jgi:hypothetical protein
MSNAAPHHNATTDVVVHTGVSGARATATAHYKTTSTTHTASAASNGIATIPFDISDAKAGFLVMVDVTVRSGGGTKTCSTAFTPIAL